MKRISVLSFGAVLIALFSANSAFATEFCSIPGTKDGFLALREQPNPKGKIIVRMKPGDEVMLNNIVLEKNGWTRVYWWKGERPADGIARGLSKSRQGWVNSKLLGDECG